MVKAKRKRTSMQVYSDTIDKLIEIGKKNDSYDDIINRLLEVNKKV